VGAPWPGHEKHAGHEQEVVAAKKARDNQKEEAGQEAQNGQHARHEHAGNEHVRKAQAHSAKEANRAKRTAHYKTSNGQYAGNEHASAQSFAGSISAEDGDEYAGDADAGSISEPAGFSATEDGNEHANARRISRCIYSKDGNEYADAFCEPVSKSDWSNARHGHERNEYG